MLIVRKPPFRLILYLPRNALIIIALQSKMCPAWLPEKLGRVKQSKERLRPEEVYSRCIDAVLLFGNYYDCGECSNMHVGVGASATALTADGVCITNYHVVEDIIKNNQKELKGDSLFYVATREGRSYAVTAILGYSEGADLAFIKVDTRGDKLACLPLSEPLEAGAEVSIISNPKQLFYIYGHGVVARNTIYNSRNPNTRRMEITPDYAEGSSGAPIIDCYGNVAGMVASTVGLYFDQEHKRDLQKNAPKDFARIVDNALGSAAANMVSKSGNKVNTHKSEQYRAIVNALDMKEKPEQIMNLDLNIALSTGKWSEALALAKKNPKAMKPVNYGMIMESLAEGCDDKAVLREALKVCDPAVTSGTVQGHIGEYIKGAYNELKAKAK